MRLTNDICRCYDRECPEHEQCARWLERETGTQHALTLRAEEPGDEGCMLRIPPQEVR